MSKTEQALKWFSDLIFDLADIGQVGEKDNANIKTVSDAVAAYDDTAIREVVAALQHISNGGYFSVKFSTHEALVEILDEYKDLADAALAKYTTPGGADEAG